MQPQVRADGRQDAPRHRRHRRRRVDHHPPSRVRRRQGQVAVPHPTVEVEAGVVEPVDPAGGDPPRQAELGRQVQQDRQRGRHRAGGEGLHRAQLLERQPAPVALVRIGRADVPIAQHHLAARQGRRDHFPHMLRPRREEDQRLGPRQHSRGGRLEQNRAQLLADGGPARLARHRQRHPPRPQRGGGGAHLRRLAAPLRPLEDDETHDCGLRIADCGLTGLSDRKPRH